MKEKRTADEVRLSRNASARKYRHTERGRKKHSEWENANYKSNPGPKKASSKRWREKNKGYFKNYYIQWRYGITTVEYNNMFTAQNGKCAICGKHQSELTKTLAVDHDHKSSVVRGLLCQNCNAGIGFLNDDVDIIRAAADYLDQGGKCDNLQVS
jgi:hypothetical protein